GIEVVEKFRGMFAIVLWYARNRELWLVRDRIGIKPLYYSLHHGRITFASEIKALLQDPEQDRSVDEESFYHFLSFLTTPAPQTLFRGIRKLPAGSWLKIRDNGSIRELQDWDVLDHTECLDGYRAQEIAERVRADLRTAVVFGIISGGPRGGVLGGGSGARATAALVAV